MLIRLTAVAVFALAPVTGLISTRPIISQSMAQAGGYFPKAAILDWNGQRFTLIRIDSFDRYNSYQASIETWIDGNPDRVAGLQAAIRRNHGLASALRDRHVQINNIGAVSEALNGNLTIYLK